MNNIVVLGWWNKLSDKEQDMLIELLYELDLNDYFEMDGDGNLIKRLK